MAVKVIPPPTAAQDFRKLLLDSLFSVIATHPPSVSELNYSSK
jgi:hypothetical protein